MQQCNLALIGDLPHQCELKNFITTYGAKWYDHKKQLGSYAVKFLQEFFGFSFQNAVIELLGEQLLRIGHEYAESNLVISCSLECTRTALSNKPRCVLRPALGKHLD